MQFESRNIGGRLFVFQYAPQKSTDVQIKHKGLLIQLGGTMREKLEGACNACPVAWSLRKIC
jgi:hypothetical protein